MSNNPFQTDVSSLVRTYDAPPEDFNPHMASDELLLRHGLPPRTRFERDPRLKKLWQRTFTSSTRFVKAEIAPDPIMTTRAQRRANDPEFLIGDWAGVTVVTLHTDPGDPAFLVLAEWVVPTVLSLGPEGSTIGFWVGIDGALNGTGGQILQAGIAAEIQSGVFGSSVEWWAWTEWFNGSSTHNASARVHNFPVAPGDSVCFMVFAPQPDQGHATMINHSQGVGTGVAINPIDGITLVGETVEWVVEQVTDALPYFYAVRFNECVALTQHHLVEPEPRSIPLAIADPAGVTLAQGGTEWPTVVGVRWEALN